MLGHHNEPSYELDTIANYALKELQEPAFTRHAQGSEAGVDELEVKCED